MGRRGGRIVRVGVKSGWAAEMAVAGEGEGRRGGWGAGAEVYENFG